MFQTVRQWWGGGRGKITARLFLFELGVVVVGVLLAQTIATYVQARTEFARMESERSRVRDELTTVHSAMQAWQVAVPCLDRRMTEVMQEMPLSTGSMRRPRFPAIRYAPPPTEIMNLIGQRYGATEKNRLNWIATMSGNASPVIVSIISRWGRLMLIDPSNGAVSASDRREARFAAADIKAQLRAMEVLSTDATKVLAKMAINARNQNEPDHGPARTCAAIWASGRLDPPRTTR